jgi:hypothetical protein
MFKNISTAYVVVDIVFQNAKNEKFIAVDRTSTGILNMIITV